MTTKTIWTKFNKATDRLARQGNDRARNRKRKFKRDFVHLTGSASAFVAKLKHWKRVTLPLAYHLSSQMIHCIQKYIYMYIFIYFFELASQCFLVLVFPLPFPTSHLFFWICCLHWSLNIFCLCSRRSHITLHQFCFLLLSSPLKGSFKSISIWVAAKVQMSGGTKIMLTLFSLCSIELASTVHVPAGKIYLNPQPL